MKRYATRTLAVLCVLAAVNILPAQQESTPSGTVYEPSASDARIVAALTARKRLGEMMRAVDVAAIESLMAPDIVVNTPINKVVNRKNIIGRLKAAQISYEPDTRETLDFVGVRADMVVIMGEEVVHPNKDAPCSGKTEFRRSTDIWKPFDGVWKLWIRQATITRCE